MRPRAGAVEERRDQPQLVLTADHPQSLSSVGR
jgi:hypothetical protein